MLKKFKGWLALSVALAAWGMVLATAMADDPPSEVLLTFAQNPVVGQRMEFAARVLDAEQEPIEGVNVTFEADMEFLNNFGTVPIGNATTDESGVAHAYYLPRTTGEIVVRAIAGEPENGETQEATGTLTVQQGPPVFQGDSPIRIPGANVWLVVAVLTSVWSVFLWMMWLLWRISSEPELEATTRGMHRE